ncbi:MAG: YbhB/YbcL family Raf kinase inhibitor-like protein [Desulfuromonadales bacterium]|jgi:Raf kinase inhibitor-like YbhB/YbcL family protein
MGLEISSPVIRNQKIPQHYTCDGDNVSPPLQWGDIPEGAKSLALIVEDPDAPGGAFIHWVMYNIPPDVRQLPEDVRRDETLPNGACQGINDFGKIGYGGPCPPGGNHRYFFKLFALDVRLDLESGATREQLTEAMQGHILAATEIMGNYARH